MDLQELEITAQLARLDMGTDQLGAIHPAFEQTIGFFDTMEKAETDPSFAEQMKLAAKHGEKSCPVSGALFVGSGQLRCDVVESSGAELREKMLDNAGERDGNFFVIPNVL